MSEEENKIIQNKAAKVTKTFFSKQWCEGFCRTCGTGCGQYCEEIHQMKSQLATLREALKRSYTALQYEIIRHNGPVPGLTDEQLFDEAILTQQNTRDALKKCFGEKEKSDE